MRPYVGPGGINRLDVRSSARKAICKNSRRSGPSFVFRARWKMSSQLPRPRTSEGFVELPTKCDARFSGARYILVPV